MRRFSEKKLLAVSEGALRTSVSERAPLHAQYQETILCELAAVALYLLYIGVMI